MILAHLSDLHIDAPGSANVLRLRQMLATLDQVRPQPTMLLLTGDLTQDGTPAQYAMLQELLVGNVPCALLPGNHDNPRLLHAAFPEASPPPGGLLQIDLTDLAMILLDSTLPGLDHGALQTQRLERVSAGIVTANKPVLLAMHHPPVAAQVPALDGMGLREPQQFAAWLNEHPGVAAVLAGHYHQAQFCVLAGRPVVVAPSVAPAVRPDFTAAQLQSQASAPAGLLHLWQGRLSSHVLLAAPAAQACPPLGSPS